MQAKRRASCRCLGPLNGKRWKHGETKHCKRDMWHGDPSHGYIRIIPGRQGKGVGLNGMEHPPSIQLFKYECSWPHLKTTKDECVPVETEASICGSRRHRRTCIGTEWRKSLPRRRIRFRLAGKEETKTSRRSCPSQDVEAIYSWNLLQGRHQAFTTSHLTSWFAMTKVWNSSCDGETTLLCTRDLPRKSCGLYLLCGRRLPRARQVVS